MKKALVFGYGRSGKAAKALLERDGFAVTALDEGRANSDVPCHASAGGSLPTDDFDFAIVSPGLALTHPWIIEAKRRGIPLKSELQLGCEELKRRGWKLLAVTGSKGKSSVVKVVTDAICLDGRQAVACGNYGVPVCEVAVSRRTSASAASWAVVEVSSFMMETTELPADTFEAAVILNLQEDHLDRHGSVEVYHALKRKLLTMARRPMDFSGERTKHDLQEHGWEGGCACYAGSYFDNEILVVNGAAAQGLMRAVEPALDVETLRRAFSAFVPLPHRMNLLAEIDGVRYIDDSKATSLSALAAGVKMAWPRRVRLIAGGLAKGDDPAAVVPVLTNRVKKVYLIGRSAESFAKAWQASVDCEVCETLERAVTAARREAEKGETVLLSPGTASFDQFRSFGERGDVFADLVKKG